MNIQKAKEIPGLQYIGEHHSPTYGNMPVYEPKAPVGRLSINTLEGWKLRVNEAIVRYWVEKYGCEPDNMEVARAEYVHHAYSLIGEHMQECKDVHIICGRQGREDHHSIYA